MVSGGGLMQLVATGAQDLYLTGGTSFFTDAGKRVFDKLPKTPKSLKDLSIEHISEKDKNWICKHKEQFPDFYENIIELIKWQHRNVMDQIDRITRSISRWGWKHGLDRDHYLLVGYKNIIKRRRQYAYEKLYNDRKTWINKHINNREQIQAKRLKNRQEMSIPDIDSSTFDFLFR